MEKCLVSLRLTITVEIQKRYDMFQFIQKQKTYHQSIT
ncbi:hypothetical protein CAEBREN_16920 [Caenorhabditis brenneri]|uniref:Uncharacterized protein n=1 Tax=Caenorhabditis brenneri TaxID=135651 RepID=G0NL00_CAEBE|nr:hypothetical protein CAEBREN_16920 [Caenorhabditis brenneri]